MTLTFTYLCVAYDGTGRELTRATRRAYWGRGVTAWFRRYLAERSLLAATALVEIHPRVLDA